MKKCIYVILAVICLLNMVGYTNRSLNYIISSEPSMIGIVKETRDTVILVENESGKYVVSLDVECADSVTHFSIGDEVVIYYDGSIAESYPMQINKVYAITLRTPADRGENDNS